MVWVWPTDSSNYDLMTWNTPQGKFEKDKYLKIYSDWFSKFELIKNERMTKKITLTKENDGAFAVVDIDTLWRSKDGEESQWLGRTGKTYVKTSNSWKMINQVGVFNF